MDDHRAGKIVVNLLGRVNKCGVISPRFDIDVNSYEDWVKRLLPSRQFGCVPCTSRPSSHPPSSSPRCSWCGAHAKLLPLRDEPRCCDCVAGEFCRMGCLAGAVCSSIVFCCNRFVVMTTSYGIMDHEECKRKHTGGKILGFFY